MSELEDKLNSVLSDPDSMAKIMGLVQSITGQENGKEAEKAEGSSADLGKLLQLVSKAELGGESRYANVLNAIKPYLRQERQERLDRALRISRLSKLAKFAMESGVIGEL